MADSKNREKRISLGNNKNPSNAKIPLSGKKVTGFCWGEKKKGTPGGIKRPASTRREK